MECVTVNGVRKLTYKQAFIIIMLYVTLTMCLLG